MKTARDCCEVATSQGAPEAKEARTRLPWGLQGQVAMPTPPHRPLASRTGGESIWVLSHLPVCGHLRQRPQEAPWGLRQRACGSRAWWGPPRGGLAAAEVPGLFRLAPWGSGPSFTHCGKRGPSPHTELRVTVRQRDRRWIPGPQVGVASGWGLTTGPGPRAGVLGEGVGLCAELGGGHASRGFSEKSALCPEGALCLVPHPVAALTPRSNASARSLLSLHLADGEAEARGASFWEEAELGCTPGSMQRRSGARIKTSGQLAQRRAPGVPAAWEAAAGGSPEPRSCRAAWATWCDPVSKQPNPPNTHKTNWSFRLWGSAVVVV